MSWENSLIRQLNPWGLAHASLVSFAANSLLYIAVGIALTIVTFDHFRNFASMSFELASIRHSLIFFLSRLLLPLVVVTSISELVPKLYFRQRPFVAFPDIHAVFHHAPDAGMPSSHTAVMIALAFAMRHYYRNWSFLLLFFALLTGFFRVVAGVHYPTDVLAGIFLGLTVPWIIDSVRLRSRFLHQR